MLRRRYLLSAALVLAIVGVWQVVASLPGVDHLTLAGRVEEPLHLAARRFVTLGRLRGDVPG